MILFVLFVLCCFLFGVVDAQACPTVSANEVNETPSMMERFFAFIYRGVIGQPGVCVSDLSDYSSSSECDLQRGDVIGVIGSARCPGKDHCCWQSVRCADDSSWCLPNPECNRRSGGTGSTQSGLCPGNGWCCRSLPSCSKTCTSDGSQCVAGSEILYANCPESLSDVCCDLKPIPEETTAMTTSPGESSTAASNGGGEQGTTGGDQTGESSPNVNAPSVGTSLNNQPSPTVPGQSNSQNTEPLGEPCPRSNCNNHGSCRSYLLRSGFKCTCESPWIGTTCEFDSDAASRTPQSSGPLIAAGVAAGLVLLLVVCLTFICLFRRRKHRRRGSRGGAGGRRRGSTRRRSNTGRSRANTGERMNTLSDGADGGGLPRIMQPGYGARGSGDVGPGAYPSQQAAARGSGGGDLLMPGYASRPNVEPVTNAYSSTASLQNPSSSSYPTAELMAGAMEAVPGSDKWRCLKCQKVYPSKSDVEFHVKLRHLAELQASAAGSQLQPGTPNNLPQSDQYRPAQQLVQEEYGSLSLAAADAPDATIYSSPVQSVGLSVPAGSSSAGSVALGRDASVASDLEARAVAARSRQQQEAQQQEAAAQQTATLSDDNFRPAAESAAIYGSTSKAAF